MPKGFAASTAASAGMTKQAINKHLARAKVLGDDLERITGTSITPARAWHRANRQRCRLMAVLVQKPRPGGYMVATRAGKTKQHYVLHSAVSLSVLVGRVGLEPTTKGL